jgi:ABC-type polysaccharide/polyol phosphate transport system ATPase subunit
MTLISLENVSKTYLLAGADKANTAILKKALGLYHGNEKEILSATDLNIEEGEIVGIIGRNGSGKSTLLKMISGIISPSSGTITINGKISAILELGFGFNPELDAIQNIRFVSSLMGISKQDLRQTIDEVLEFAELKEYVHQPIKQYSSGMRARLAFGIATATSPDILIVDEVLAVGDGIFRRKCNHRMQNLIARGKTVLYVSHNMNSVRSLCNRVLLIEKGEIVLDGDPKAVTQAYEEIMNTGSLASPEKYKQLIEPADPTKISVLNFKNETKNIDVSLTDCTLLSEEYQQTGTVEYLSGQQLVVEFVFACSVDNVSVGIAIKDHQGLAIAGIVEPSFSSDIEHIEKGTALKVNWEFDLKMLPGTYFFAVDIRQQNRENSLYVVEDVIAFKVVTAEKHRNVGVVNIDRAVSHTITDRCSPSP